MTEHVGTPFTAYNNTGNVATLVGNWQEEAVLKAVTGTSRNKVLLCHISNAVTAKCNNNCFVGTARMVTAAHTTLMWVRLALQRWHAARYR